MRLRHIEVFHAIMQAGTISGAAQILFISQPATTKILQHCETQLGYPLFERIKGRLYPTPEAQKLFAEVDKVNRDLLAVRRLAENLKQRQTETVRVVSTPSLAICVLPLALGAWRKKFREVRCNLATHHTREIVANLLLGEADFGLSLQEPKHPGINAESLAHDCMTAIAPLGTWPQSTAAQPLPVQDLPHSLITLPDDDPLGVQVTALCDFHGIPIQPHTVVQTYQLAMSLVENGAGTAVIDPFTSAFINRAKGSARRLSPAIDVHLYLLTANAAPLSQAARHLVKCIRDAATQRLSGQV